MIDKQQVDYIASLARLQLSEQEAGSFAHQLARVVEYMDQLNRADTDGVEPTCFVTAGHDPLREDREKPSLQPADACRNGPVVKKGFFAIPRVIG